MKRYTRNQRFAEIFLGTLGLSTYRQQLGYLFTATFSFVCETSSFNRGLTVESALS